MVEVARHRAAGLLVIGLVAMMTIESLAQSRDEQAKIVERDVRPILEDAGGIAVAFGKTGEPGSLTTAMVTVTGRSRPMRSSTWGPLAKSSTHHSWRWPMNKAN